MKIAIPVKDENLEVSIRTGRTPYFAIFENDKFECLIKNLYLEHEEREDDHLVDHMSFHRQQVELIKDCQVILVKKIGKHIKTALEEKNIKIVEFPQEEYKFAKQLVDTFLSKK